MKNRKVLQIIQSQRTTDGDNVKISRIATAREPLTDPFLLLDELHSDQQDDFGGGFPEHPHRGFETLSYMIRGGFLHRDHLGNESSVASGGAQWMSTGRGILHSEMPIPEGGGLHGFQLWINLPAAEKMKVPEYLSLEAADLPMVELKGGGTLRAIAGSWQLAGSSLQSPLNRVSGNAQIADLRLPPNTDISLEVPAEKRVLLYSYDGSLNGDILLKAGQMAILGDGEQIVLQSGGKGVGLLVLAGQPLGEPVVNYGPFVMNTHKEIEQAIQDYKEGRLVEPGQRGI